MPSARGRGHQHRRTPTGEESLGGPPSETTRTEPCKPPWDSGITLENQPPRLPSAAWPPLPLHRVAALLLSERLRPSDRAASSTA